MKKKENLHNKTHLWADRQEYEDAVKEFLESKVCGLTLADRLESLPSKVLKDTKTGVKFYGLHPIINEYREYVYVNIGNIAPYFEFEWVERTKVECLKWQIHDILHYNKFYHKPIFVRVVMENGDVEIKRTRSGFVEISKQKKAIKRIEELI